MGETPKTPLDRVAEIIYRDHDGYWLNDSQRELARWVIAALGQMALEDLNSMMNPK